MDDKLQRMVEKENVQKVFTMYASSVDRRDWPGLQSLFTDELERDLSSFTGSPPQNIKSEQHVTECQSTLPGFDSTQHFLLNSEININGEQATADVYMIADHTLDEDDEQKQFTLRGIYNFRFVRLGAEWKISGLTLQVKSTQGDQRVFETAAKRVAAKNEANLDS